MRLFVAVNLPSQEKLRLAALLEPLRVAAPDVRWVDAESLHITLKFLGEVADANLAAVRAALRQAALGIAPFDMEVGGFGTFPSATRARVFWIGVQAPAALYELQQHVEQQIAPLGFPTEKRQFQAHLTLGRARGTTMLERAAVDRIAARVVYKVTVRIDSVDLMRSHLSPRGARYELIEAARLEA